MKPYYERGGITIYHGDCREILGDLACDAIVTDPPYGIGYVHGTRKGGIALGHDGISIVGDGRPFEPAWLLGRAPRLILWGANHYAPRLPASPGWLVWDKREGVGPNDQSDCEMAWTNFLTVARLYSRYWNGGGRRGAEAGARPCHPSQKPVGLMAWCLGLLPPEAVVLDPFMGSGTTLRAAKDLGRRAIGIEIEERYCEIAARRLAQEVLPLEVA